MNRTRGFVNLNRFKSGRAIKRLKDVVVDKRKVKEVGSKRKGLRLSLTLLSARLSSLYNPANGFLASV